MDILHLILKCSINNTMDCIESSLMFQIKIDTMATDDKIRVVVWNEFKHEKEDASVKANYPNGIHECIAGWLRKEPDMDVKTATLPEKEHGLTQKVLDNTDVLIWWGHAQHDKVKDEIVDRIQKRILEGMGLIALYSSHMSKIFKRMNGTSLLFTMARCG